MERHLLVVATTSDTEETPCVEPTSRSKMDQPAMTERDRKKRQLQDSLKQLKSLIRMGHSSTSGGGAAASQVDTIQAVNMALRIIGDSYSRRIDDAISPVAAQRCFRSANPAVVIGRNIPEGSEQIAELVIDRRTLTVLDLRSLTNYTSKQLVLQTGQSLFPLLASMIDDSTFDDTLRSSLDTIGQPFTLYTRIRINDEVCCGIIFCDPTPSARHQSSLQEDAALVSIHQRPFEFKSYIDRPSGSSSREFMTKHLPSLRLRGWDPSLLHLLGHLPQSVVGVCFLEWLHHQDVSAFVHAFLDAAHSCRKCNLIRTDKPFRLRTATGSYVSVRSEWYLHRCPWSGSLESVRGRHRLVADPSSPSQSELPYVDPLNLSSASHQERLLQLERQLETSLTQLCSAGPSSAVASTSTSKCDCLPTVAADQSATRTSSDENHNTRSKPPPPAAHSRPTLATATVSALIGKSPSRNLSLKRPGGVDSHRHRSSSSRKKRRRLRADARNRRPITAGATVPGVQSATAPSGMTATLGAYVDRLVETMVIGTTTTANKHRPSESRSGSSDEVRRPPPVPPVQERGRGARVTPVPTPSGGGGGAGTPSGGDRSPQDSSGTGGSNSLSYTQISCSCLENVHRLLQSHPTTTGVLGSRRSPPSHPGANSSPSEGASPPAPAIMHRSHSAGEVAADQPMPLTRELLREHTRQWERECKESWKRRCSTGGGMNQKVLSRASLGDPLLNQYGVVPQLLRGCQKYTKELMHTEITVSPLPQNVSVQAVRKLATYNQPLPTTSVGYRRLFPDDGTALNNPRPASMPGPPRDIRLLPNNAGMVAPKGVDFYRALGPNPPPPPGRNFRITSFPIPQSSLGMTSTAGQFFQSPTMTVATQPQITTSVPPLPTSMTAAEYRKTLLPCHYADVPSTSCAPSGGTQTGAASRRSAFVTYGASSPQLGFNSVVGCDLTVIQASPLLQQLSQQYQMRQQQHQQRLDEQQLLIKSGSNDIDANMQIHLQQRHMHPQPPETPMNLVLTAGNVVSQAAPTTSCVQTEPISPPQALSAVKEATLMLLQGT